MSCQTCRSQRIANVCGKASDMCAVNINTCDGERAANVPRDMGIGGGDYLRFSMCLDCGQLQGKWPLAATELERNGDLE